MHKYRPQATMFRIVDALIGHRPRLSPGRLRPDSHNSQFVPVASEIHHIKLHTNRLIGSRQAQNTTHRHSK